MNLTRRLPDTLEVRWVESVGGAMVTHVLQSAISQFCNSREACVCVCVHMNGTYNVCVCVNSVCVHVCV